jgi:hypothetical protein
MRENNEGLCSTCKYSSECTLTRTPSQNIHFCEEYQTADSSGKSRRTRLYAGTAEKGGADSKAYPQSPVLGLCSNCIHRKTCGFSRPESGVWHCEEYE